MTAPAGVPTRTGRLRQAVPLAASAVFVAGVLILLVSLQSSAEAAATGLAASLPVGYAFGAGMVASVNPCGFLLLPSYISFNLGTDSAGYYDGLPAARGLRALALGVMATVGFVLVFAVTGTVTALGGQWLAGYFAHIGTAVGVAMAGLGLWLLVTHRTLGIDAATRVNFAPRRTVFNGFLFGIAYAAGSLGCTLPIFLVVLGSAITARDLGQALAQFVGYSLGMGAVMTAVTLSVALFRDTLGQALRAAIPQVHRLSALFLIAAGMYLVYYWTVYARV